MNIPQGIKVTPAGAVFALEERVPRLSSLFRMGDFYEMFLRMLRLRPPYWILS